MATSDLYGRVALVTCPTCTRHGIGPGQPCVTVGGNPREGFHAARIRSAIKVGAIRKDEYDEAYRLKTSDHAPKLF